MDEKEAKKKAGIAAAQLIENGMTVGLGTGSTAEQFIEALGKRVQKEKLRIRAVSSSQHSLAQAQMVRIPVEEIDKVDFIDITVDGADEIDPQKRMIKGGGGALLREKIVATMSHEMVVVIDETKQVPYLGKRKLPVEVIPFGSNSVLKTIQKRTPIASFRMDKGEKFITDNGNYLIDIEMPYPITSPEKEHALLKEIPGVIETGFFFQLAGRVIVAYFDGQVVTLP